MRSPVARWTLVTVTWIAFAAAGFYIFQAQRQIAAGAGTLRTLDQHASAAHLALFELRAGQQAYVASGQGVAFWMPKVAATAESASAALNALREAAGTQAGRSAVDEALSAMRDFNEIDKRARDYLRAGQALMASDVIFTEGGQAVTNAVRETETARQAERQEFDAREAGLRKQQMIAAGGAAALATFIVLLLAPAGSRSESEEAATNTGTIGLARTSAISVSFEDMDEGIVSHAKRVETPKPAAPPAPALVRSAPVLRAAADLATDFGRARDSDELSRLLARTADMIDASGLVVWVGDTSGSDLRPIIAHGYTPQVLARIPAVPRGADNAAASAYRTGTTQIVLSRPGGPAGAIVAPILGADGCIGALSAEIKSGGEGSEAVQAVTAIVASHLATVLAAAATEQAAMPESRAAHG